MAEQPETLQNARWQTSDLTEMLGCPFCGGKVFIHTGYQNLSFITCGQRDDGSDGCGAVVSFRPDLRGNAARNAWNKRVPNAELTRRSTAIDNTLAASGRVE